MRLPGLGFRDEIILPPSSLRWLLTQPDQILGVDDSFLDGDQVEKSLGHVPYVRDAWSNILIRRELNTVLDIFTAELRDELFASLDEHLGRDTDSWTDVDLSETLRTVIARSSSRFTVGDSLCMWILPHLRSALTLNVVLTTSRQGYRLYQRCTRIQ